jgi:predicted transcriptional regulator
MDTQLTRDTGKEATKLVRTSVLLREDTDRALRDLAEKGRRPLSREIRTALEEYVEKAAA